MGVGDKIEENKKINTEQMSTHSVAVWQVWLALEEQHNDDNNNRKSTS